jgi:hypothetical protein
MTDYLVMLLSTDWFLPFWSEIGIDAGTDLKDLVKESCRAMVRHFMGTGEDYFRIDFRDERMRETHSQFIGLLREYGLESVVNIETFAHSGDDLGIGLMLRALTHDLLSEEKVNAIPSLDDVTRIAIAEGKKYDLDPSQLSKTSRESGSGWDKYLESVFCDVPDTLSTFAMFSVQRYRLKHLWMRMCEILSEVQRSKLLEWYRIRARSIGFPGDIDPVPQFILNSRK